MAGATDSTVMYVPEFSGKGDSDADKHWFLCESIWRAKRVAAPESKLVEFQTTLLLRALQWYIKFIQTGPGYGC